MNDKIKTQIEKLEYPERLRVIETIDALDDGRCIDVEFFADGSGVSFEYQHPTIDHGLPGRIMRSFNTQIAMLILAGHRLK